MQKCHITDRNTEQNPVPFICVIDADDRSSIELLLQDPCQQLRIKHIKQALLSIVVLRKHRKELEVVHALVSVHIQ